MPVARIISSSFEDALRFADYLRPLYDTVEIAQPGRSYDTAVDLEVNLELCTPEEAWQQIAQLSQQPDSEIVVAPGALFPEEQVEKLASSETPVTPKPEPLSPAPAGTSQEFDSAGLEVDAAIVRAGNAAAKAAGSNGSGTHKEHSIGTVPEEELNWLGRARESLRQWLAVRALLREIRQMQQEELAQEQARQRQMALRFERERREQEARELAAARAAEQPPVAVSPPEPQLEQWEEVALAEQQAILPRQAEDEELQRQAEREEAIRRGWFVEQILRRRAAEQAAQALEAAATPEGEAVPVEFQAVPAESFAAETIPVVRFSRPRRDQLRPAMALAGVTSVLLMAVLVGYAHRRPASPLPLSVLQRSNAVEQKVPFGPAVIPAAARVAMPLTQTTAEALPEAAPLPGRHSFRSDFRRVQVDGHEVDYVADDVTVRHFNEHRRRIATHPATTVPISASTPGVKQISDME
ncbi:MAG TPA: hypothetical protein VGR48_15510 [Terriglobales bacterium]|nr:hypothetical protein [Terriglobales bacterium]